MNEFLPQPKPVKKVKTVKTGKLAKPTRKAKKKVGGVPKNIRQKALTDFQKLRKIQESINGMCYCISCGRPIRLGDATCQGGHYISRQNRATELEPDNIWPQCSRCNVLLKGNPVAYRYNLILKIGEERVKRLENMALAREGNEEALKSLSKEDQFKALYKNSSKDYQALDTKYRQMMKDLEG